MRKKTAEKGTGTRGKKSNGIGGNGSWEMSKRGWLDCVANDTENVRAVGEDVYDRERWRKVVSATATPHESGNS